MARKSAAKPSKSSRRATPAKTPRTRKSASKLPSKPTRSPKQTPSEKAEKRRQYRVEGSPREAARERKRLAEQTGVPYWQVVEKEINRQIRFISERVKSARARRAIPESTTTLEPFKPITGKQSAFPRRTFTRPTARFAQEWIRYSLRQRGLHKAAKEAAGLTDSQIEKIRAGKLTPALKTKLRSAYEKTQYAKLRRVGLSAQRARANAKKLPVVVAKIRREMTRHAKEIILRKLPDAQKPKSRRSFQRLTRKVLNDMAKSNYTPEQWEFFSDWYQRNPNKPLTRGQWRDIRMKKKEFV